MLPAGVSNRTRRCRPILFKDTGDIHTAEDVFGYAEPVRRIGGDVEGWTRVVCGEHEFTQYGFNAA